MARLMSGLLNHILQLVGVLVHCVCNLQVADTILHVWVEIRHNMGSPGSLYHNSDMLDLHTPGKIEILCLQCHIAEI